ncbi:unnamed protein product [Trichobilharzia regenti]|nr:unnamed protein product [Trichobilharzia regenti]
MPSGTSSIGSYSRKLIFRVWADSSISVKSSTALYEFIDENVYNNAITATPVTPTADAITIPPAAAANTTTNNDDDNEREYLDLDEVQQSRYTGLQTPNIICYLDESINYYPISGSSSSQPVDEINAHPGDQRTTHRHNDSDLVIEELL